MEKVKKQIEEDLKKLDKSVSRKIMDVSKQFLTEGLNEENIEELTVKANEIFHAMFANPYGTLIPLEFVESEIGRILFSIKIGYMGTEGVYYGASDAAILKGKSRAMIIKDIESGALVAKRISGRNVIKKLDLIAYLVNQGKESTRMSESIARDKIAKLTEMRNQGCKDSEIREVFKYNKSWMNYE